MATLKRPLDQPDDLEFEFEFVPPFKLLQLNPSLIDHLPLHIFIKVINYVPKMQWPSLELVNRKFRDVMYKVWLTLKKVRLDEDFLRSDSKNESQWMEAVLKKLLKRAPNLIDFNFDTADHNMEKSFNLLALFEKLERLKIEKATKDEVTEFLNKSRSRRNLKQLVVKNRKIEKFDSKEEVVINHDLVPMKLEMIDLGNDWDFPEWISSDIDASHLKSLSIPVAEDFLLELLVVITRVKNLKSLKLCFKSHFNQVVISMLNKFFHAVSNLEHLESLTLNGSQHIEYGGVTKMLNQIGHRGILKELSITGDFATSDILDCIKVSFSNLQCLEFDIGNCDGDSVEHALSAQRSLINLHLISDQYHDIPIIPHLIGCMNTLKSLRLEYWDRAMSRRDRHLLALFTRLNELSLNLHGFINDSVLAAWGDGFGSRLKYFSVHSWNKVTDAGLVAFLSQTPRLQHLSLKSDTELAISDEALKEIPRLCPNLTRLSLKYCGKKITTTSLQGIIDKCSMLKTLRIRSQCGDVEFFDRLKAEKYRKISILNS